MKSRTDFLVVFVEIKRRNAVVAQDVTEIITKQVERESALQSAFSNKRKEAEWHFFAIVIAHNRHWVKYITSAIDIDIARENINKAVELVQVVWLMKAQNDSGGNISDLPPLGSLVECR